MKPSDEKMLITGYQYGPNFSLLGVYQFPNNEDKEDIHLPPNTTLAVPPMTIPDGQEAAFAVSQGVWYLRDIDLSWMDMDGRIKFVAHRSEVADAAQQVAQSNSVALSQAAHQVAQS